MYALAIQGPGNEGVVSRAITSAARAGPYLRLRAAYAYASSGGVLELVDVLRKTMPAFGTVEKYWLISFDFGLTDPRAVELLASLPNSNVRIPNAREVLASTRLAPARTFHPKTLILDQGTSGRTVPFAVVIGSANLTISGLRAGSEDISVASWVRTPTTKSRQLELDAAIRGAARFDRAWRAADPISRSLLDEYRARKPARSTPEDSNRRVREIERERVIGFDQAAAIAASSRVWVEVENVAENLGPRKPGNQLHLRRGTRVFFGVSAREVPKMTQLAISISCSAGVPSQDTFGMPTTAWTPWTFLFRE